MQRDRIELRVYQHEEGLKIGLESVIIRKP